MDLNSAFAAICDANDEDLVQLDNFSQVLQRLKRAERVRQPRPAGLDLADLPNVINKRLEELKTFCSQDPASVFGTLPKHDYRVVDIRFVSGKTGKLDLRAELRRVFGELSLTHDFVEAHPQRLNEVVNGGALRRGADSIRKYASTHFPEDHRIVRTAIGYGMKHISLQMALFPTNNYALSGLIAISYHYMKATKISKLKETFKSEKLSQALVLTASFSQFFEDAFNAYKGQDPQQRRVAGAEVCQFDSHF